MKRYQIVIAILLLTVAAAMQAQTDPQSGTADHPALISNTNAQAIDSPLVSLAKRTVSQRRVTGVKAMAVITNANVGNSNTVLTTSSGSAAIPDYTSKIASPTAPQATPAPGTTARSTNLGYAAQAASDPTMPQISTNSNSANSPRTAQNASDTSALRQATNSTSPYAPRTAQNSNGNTNPQQSTNSASPYSPQPATNSTSSTAPRPSTNAGPYRQKP